MATLTPATRRPVPVVALIAMCLVVLGGLCIRNYGLSPVIFADEWYYSKMARLMPLREAIVPSYLYLWLFRSTNACGTGFLDCVRFGNNAFFVAATPFVYLLARRIAGARTALYVALLALLAPVGIYTAFFMPESMYYFGFMVLSWVLLARGGRGWWIDGLSAGFVLGLMTLVKVHALFLLPALCLYLLLAGWLRDDARWLGAGIAAALLAAVATVAFKFGIGYLLAGDAGLSLFGPFYGMAASASSGRPPAELLYFLFVTGKGHLMALVVVYALPLALIARTLLSSAARAASTPAVRQLQLYTLLMTGSAAGLAVVYTASVAGTNPGELLRLHMRYYDFVAPLLLMVAAAAAAQPAPADRTRTLRGVIALLLAAILAAAVVLLPRYTLMPTDAPDIQTLHVEHLVGRLIVALDLLVLVLWARGSRLAAPLFMYGLAPLITVISLAYASAYLEKLRYEPVLDRAGKFARDHVPPAERGSITVAGTDVGAIMHTQFFIDDAATKMLDLPADAPIESYQIPMHTKWLLVVGNHPLPEGVKPFLATPDYVLVKVENRTRSLGVADIAAPLPNGPVTAIEGLSHIEPWGRWSEARQVVIHLRAPLPDKAVLILTGMAYGPNAAELFTLHVGNQVQHFRMGSNSETIGLRLFTDGAQRTIVIGVPKPTSPRSISPSVDVRPLGIGLAKVEVAAVDQ